MRLAHVSEREPNEEKIERGVDGPAPERMESHPGLREHVANRLADGCAREDLKQQLVAAVAAITVPRRGTYDAVERLQ